jgi:hypothetical protein
VYIFRTDYIYTYLYFVVTPSFHLRARPTQMLG